CVCTETRLVGPQLTCLLRQSALIEIECNRRLLATGNYRVAPSGPDREAEVGRCPLPWVPTTASGGIKLPLGVRSCPCDGVPTVGQNRSVAPLVSFPEAVVDR